MGKAAERGGGSSKGLPGGFTSQGLPDTVAAASRPDELSLLIGGDMVLTQPWSRDPDPAFRDLVDVLRSADVTLVNLEEVINDFHGYAQAHGDGGWLAARREIAREVAWAGIDMVSHANNHSFDYGSLGVLENLKNVREAGIVLAGSGEDLPAARAPRYFRHQESTFALVSAASTFTPYGLASNSRPGVAGRPGINPLRIISDTRFTLAHETASGLQRAALALGFSGCRFGRPRFQIAGFDFRIDDRFSIASGTRPDPSDLEGNLAAVREAANKSDVVIFSLHSHRQGSWLRGLAHRILDAGADVFVAHGPHEIQGIEIYAGKPIFYCLGNFSFQVHQIDRYPDDTYERYGLGDNATPEDLRQARLGGLPGTLWPRQAWESVAASLRIAAGRVLELRLLPLDLRRDDPDSTRGTPRLADPELGRSIIARIASRSRRYGAEICWDEEGYQGFVTLD